jgi:hypothetical protein
MRVPIPSRRAVAALGVVVAAVTPTTPASADTSVGNPLGGSSVSVVLGHSLSQSISLAPVPASLNGYSVVATCTATALPDASSTAVEKCTVNGVGIPSRVSLPGNAAAAATVATAFRNTWAVACVQTSAQFVESVLGPGSITNPERCYPVFLP